MPCRGAYDVDVVLDGDRDAGEGQGVEIVAVGKRLRFRERFRTPDDLKRADPRLQTVDTLEMRGDYFGRAHNALAH